ncbi:MAG: UPF0323 family lipoprotein [Sulfurovum sp.]|nr:UPF0323 family lipoprotein [Sulfurovaceae bacterium]
MKYLKKLSDYATVGGLGALLVTGLTGCEERVPTEQPKTQQQEKKAAFVIIEEVEKGKYKVKDEFPAEETRIILKKLDGTEKVLTQEEMDKLVKDEAAKIDNGTSNLTKDQSQNPEVANQGMSLGETILASAAGAMLGAWIGSKLFGNSNYQNNRRAGYKSPSTLSKSNSNFSKAKSGSSTTKGKSGFFGSKKSSSPSSRSSSSSRRSSFGG